MIHIKLNERLQPSFPQNNRNYITSDETWSFTEQPKTDLQEKDKKRIPAHELFSLFTADIIRKNTVFIR